MLRTARSHSTAVSFQQHRSTKYTCFGFLVALLILPASVQAQEEDEDFPPGLLATYSVGDTELERVDKVMSFDWGTSAPDQRLAEGPFAAEWSGNLLARLPGNHSFHATVSGSVTISIDGTEVLQAAEKNGFVSGNPIELSSGDHEINIRFSTYKDRGAQPAKLAIFWSSDKFTLEPLPADVLFRDESSDSWKESKGHQLADAHRCAACHRDHSGVESIKAPALNQINGSQTQETLRKRLLNPKSVVTNSHMPDFGMSPEEADSIAAFLASVSKAAPKQSQPKFKDADADTGTKLLNSLGCVACHKVPGASDEDRILATPYDGPELATVGQRRTAGWLDLWLSNPKSLNADHRMPVFELSRDERRQLVASLTKGQSTASGAAATTVSKDRSIIAAGKELVASANCASCHNIPGMTAKPLASLAGTVGDSAAVRCLHTGDDRQNRVTADQRIPSFRLAEGDADALVSWLKTTQHDSPISVSDQGKQLLSRNGCIACHDRNLGLGLSKIAGRLEKAHPGLKGRSQGLVPPSLTAVGDKLNDDYLKTAVAGEQKEKRLPWLMVRMPKFRHTEEQRAAIVRHLISTDRIPSEADAVRQDVLAQIDVTGQTKATTEELLIGNELMGAGGFNCVACHKAGAFEPRKVALGTRGSDIMTMGGRIRPRFFQRWMKNPIRVVAGIEMPAIKKAMPDMLHGSLPQQIGTIWKALSDKRFTPPTVTSRFEQVVNVAPGAPPRIIRDVFTIGSGKDRQVVARSMAIGFENGHNVLINLDTMQVRLWTIGEFARQRTEGKGWYWDMPGTVVQDSPAVAFQHRLISEASVFEPVIDEDRAAELLSYKILTDGVEFTMRSWFDTSGNPAPTGQPTDPHFAVTRWADPARPLQVVVTRHTFQAYQTGENQTGWKRSVEVLECPEGLEYTASSNQLLADVDTDVPVARTLDTAVNTSLGRGEQTFLAVTANVGRPNVRQRKPLADIKVTSQTLTSTPGFVGTRLPIRGSVMPTAMTWLPDGRMAFTSLKGHVWIAEDTDNDGFVDNTILFEEGLASPFGILADGDDIIVSHKPEILRLRDTDGDGRADQREMVASGWGFNDNYHDWVAGLVKDTDGNMYAGLGSDYSQKSRPDTQDRWRGGVIKIDPTGKVTPLGMSMRYPLGLAIDKHNNLFATDNQGVQNTYNEINHIQVGKHYGVPSRHQPTDGLKTETPAVMVPHPWTRSMNSIVFLPEDYPVAELRGQGIGCEYDSRFLMRFTIQDVDGVLQGASYRFSLPDQEAGGSNFIGPISSAVSPDGELFIGSIWDSGWQGGRNTGGISKLVPSKDGLPNGIQEITATADGFEVTFFDVIDKAAAQNPKSWSIQGYTRDWGGGYATPDSGRHTVDVQKIVASDDGKRLHITVSELKPEHVYDISTTGPLAASKELWPSEAHYSMKVIPK